MKTLGGLWRSLPRCKIDLAMKHRLPLISGHLQFAAADGFMSYGVDIRDVCHRMAMSWTRS